MFGWSIIRTERVTALEAENVRLREMDDAERKRLVDVGMKRQATDHHLAQLRQGEHTKRWEAKAGVSKEVIREMREAIKVAIVSIRDLAKRRPNEVTAAHLAELSAQAENLVQYTSLPR